MFKIPFQIYQHIILDFLGTIDQIRLIKTNTFFNKLGITDLCNGTSYLYCNIDDIFLSKPRFKHLKKLYTDPHEKNNGYYISESTLKKFPLTVLYMPNNCGIKNINSIITLQNLNIQYCPNITDLSNLINLRYLALGGESSNLTTDALNKLTNLTELYLSYNTKITDINNLTNLKILDIDHDEALTNTGIKNLNLTELSICQAEITNINHMTNLKKLTVLQSEMADNDIKNINPNELILMSTKNITDLNHMTNLQKLTILDYEIGNNSIKNLNLIEFDCGRNNKKLTDLNHMTNLKILKATGEESEISDESIKNLNLVELHISDNKKITNIDHMTNLETLNAYGDCINDQFLKNLNLKSLDVANNPNVTNINHMTNLTWLNASGDQCGLSDEGIKGCINLKKVYSDRNEKIKKQQNIQC